jgi:UDPglucose 6-dehydrogenase
MKITVIGAGYVGLVTAACLADIGHNVMCIDIDESKVEVLNNGGIPIYEPGLQQVVQRNKDLKRLSFSSDVVAGVHFGDVQFIAVGTPPGEDGTADMKYVLAAAQVIGMHMDGYKLVVNKSTVPVGTGESVIEVLNTCLNVRGISTESLVFDVVSNPEFLKEGDAVQDFMHPDRIVVGARTARAFDMMRVIYGPVTAYDNSSLIEMSIESSELTKYAANSMLAVRISFMNELSALADKVGADIDSVRFGIGSDKRIGDKFLAAGCGYGGSCLPKDVKAMMQTASTVGVPLSVVQAAEQANDRQKLVLVDKVVEYFGSEIAGLNIAVWGLAFKPETDDMREALSIPIIIQLIALGASITAYDPAATNNCRALFSDVPGVSFATSATAALDGADALMIITEWSVFKSFPLEIIKAKLVRPVVFDGRNIFSPVAAAEIGLKYHSIGRKIYE